MDYNRLYEQLPKVPVKWTVSDIQQWLKFIGLSTLYPSFKQLSIDGSCIGSLTEQDLKDELQIQSGIIIKKLMSWINKGLKQYNTFVTTRQNSPVDLREVTQKPRIGPLIPDGNVMSTFKQPINKMPSPTVIHPPAAISLVREPAPEAHMPSEESLMVEQDEQHKFKEYQLIIQQSDGPQTSFFSVKEEGAKIGRHSSNQILILDQSISRYHAQIKFENQQFFLKDIGSTTGTFIKIQEARQIQDKMIIQMGSNQFQASLLNGALTLTIIEGPAHDAFIEIARSQNKVTIGRKPNNVIHFVDDQHLSNTHATIQYQGGKYYVQDMATTNGTWERLSSQGEQSDLFSISDGTVFKIGTNQTYVCKVKMSLVSHKSHPNACVICCDSDKDCVYMPCKHNTACIKCSKNLKECPICRQKIVDFVRIYKS